ncbi:MAG: ABC transporter substrate-binding protein [Acidimicrobiaceae bacterium]|nr:ABC transporter substrate-binding protein [Acidimicrobiaceae bacterium]
MKRITRLAALLPFIMVAAACGTSTDDASSEAAETTVAETPSETTAPEADSEVAEAPDAEVADDPGEEDEMVYPSAIISLSATATEMLYAVGAGDQVLAVDDFSNFPVETADKMPGVSGYDPNVEAIIGLGPDLILTDGTNPDFLEALDRAGIPHWEGAAAVTVDDTFAQILEIGAATGHAEEAGTLVDELTADLDALLERIATLPKLETPLTFYHELDSTYYSVTSETFIGSTYTSLGLRNIADLVEEESYGYPQLSAEFILDKDPDIIFLACTIYCGETPESVAARPGWDALSAVSAGHVVPLNDDIASRWGPRIIEHMSAVVDAVEAVVNASGAE